LRKAIFENNVKHYRVVEYQDTVKGLCINPSDIKKRSQVTSLFYTATIVAKCYPSERDPNGFERVKLTLVGDDWYDKSGRKWKVKGI
jgi:hypothetical protein